MPSPDVSIGEQLAALLDETGLSQRELARRLAIASGAAQEDLAFKRSWNAWLRWLPKVLRPDQKDGIRIPTAKRIALLEQAAGRPGYFKIPARQPRAITVEWKTKTDNRLGVLEETAARAEDLARIDRVLRAAILALASGDAEEAQRVLSAGAR